MTPEPMNHLDEVGRLVGLLLAGELPQDDCRRLEQILLSDAAALEYYQDYVELHSLLHWQHGVADEADEANDECGMMNDELPSRAGIVIDLHAAAPIHHSSFIIQHSAFSPLPSPLSSLPSFFGGVLFSYLVAAVILSTALAVAWAWKLPSYTEIARGSVPGSSPLVPRPSAKQFVARITGLIDCQWADPATEAFKGASVPLGRKYALSSGLMEITYDSGAKVILQGPCTYEVESAAGGFLSVGKLTAKVEKKAEGGRRKAEETTNLPSPDQPSVGARRGAGGGQKYENGDRSQTALTLALSQGERGPNSSSAFRLPPSALFFVRTPTAVVTDLGTEFGVEVGADGRTLSHVFRGSIEVLATTVGGETAIPARVLHENESAIVKRAGDSLESGSRVAVFASSAKPPLDFVRTLPTITLKTLDLVDVVAGGDGLGGRRNRGIDPTTGQVADTPSMQPRLLDDGKYHRVEGLPFVDGVFVPDGRTGSVQIDSAGHVFDAFPATAYETNGHIWAGGILPLDDPAQPELHAIPAELDGIDRASPGHGVIYLHANKGISFDLDAIRRANPGCKLLRFLAVAGNTERATARGISACADFWVFVDGKSRFQRRQIDSSHGAFAIAIPVKEENRFLTLVATDGDNGICGDWIMFGDPRLELSTRADAVQTEAKR